jgi:predicted Zn-dependent peptidase
MKHVSVKKYKLANGMSFFYCHTPESSAFEISININTGARDELSTDQGESHFLEHMMFRGSKNYPNSIILAKEMEKFGGEINAMTGMEHTNYWMKGDTEKIKDAIACFAEFFFHPNFADFEIERNIILQEMASDYNDDGKCIDIEALSMSTMFKFHPLGNFIIGNDESINKINVDKLNKKRGYFYIPKRSILTLHSHLSEEEALKLIEKYFDGVWNHAFQEVPERFTAHQFINSCIENPKKFSTDIFLQNNADNQYVLKYMFLVPGGLSRDVVLTTFLQRILDDGICTRLPGRIREKYGLVYDISCDTQFFHEIGVLGIEATVSKDLIKDLIEKLKEEILFLLSQPPSVEEMEHIRYRYLFDLKQILENPSRALSREVNAHFMDSEFSLRDEMDFVRSVQAEDIAKMAHAVLYGRRKIVVLVGPRAKKMRALVENLLSI